MHVVLAGIRHVMMLVVSKSRDGDISGNLNKGLISWRILWAIWLPRQDVGWKIGIDFLLKGNLGLDMRMNDQAGLGV